MNGQKKLSELVEVEFNNKDCIVLKVKPNSEAWLISLGCFDGNETRMRLTKGLGVTCTIWRDGDKPYSWSWGQGGRTMVDGNTERMGMLIQDCAELDFDVAVMANEGDVAYDMYANEMLGRRIHSFSFMTYKNHFDEGHPLNTTGFVMKKDGISSYNEYAKGTIGEVLERISSAGYEVEEGFQTKEWEDKYGLTLTFKARKKNLFMANSKKGE